MTHCLFSLPWIVLGFNSTVLVICDVEGSDWRWCLKAVWQLIIFSVNICFLLVKSPYGQENLEIDQNIYQSSEVNSPVNDV